LNQTPFFWPSHNFGVKKMAATSEKEKELLRKEAAMVNTNETLKTELQFRLSLMRLLTEPHPPAQEAEKVEFRQLAELVEKVDGR
jgi:hypothetical protein